MDALSLLRERAVQDEPNSLFSLINDLSKVLCKKISGENLWSLVLYLLEGLVDYQGHSSSGACVVLNQIAKLRGKSLEERVCYIIYNQCPSSCLGCIVNADTATVNAESRKTVKEKVIIIIAV